MIEFTFKGKLKFCVEFTFFAAMALFFYFDKTGMGLMSISACIIHETGHLLILFAEKRDFSTLTFYGGGIKIGYEKKQDMSVLLIIAGSLFNFIIFIVFYFFTPFYLNVKMFAVINLIIGVFNLLPIQYFDGGRLLEKVFIRFFSFEKALNLSKKTEKTISVFSLIILVLIMVSGFLNHSVLIVIIYIFMVEFISKRM